MKERYRSKVFEDMKSNGRDLKTFYILSSVVLVNQKFAKILQENTRNGESKCLYCSNSKHGKAYIHRV